MSVSLENAQTIEERELLLRYLSRISEENSNPRTRDRIARHLSRYSGQLGWREIMLLGTVGGERAESVLRTHTTAPELIQERTDWASRFALAKLGSDMDANIFVEFVKNQQNQLIKTMYFDKLAYTRHPICIQILIDVLQSNEKLLSLDPHGDPEYFRYLAEFASDALRMCFKDFPEVGHKTDKDDLRMVREFCKDWKSKEIIR